MSAPRAYAAALRVYEPLAAFEGAERQRWQELAAAGSAVDASAGLALEREAALRAAAGTPPRALPALDEQAHLLVSDGVTLVCPWRTTVRARLALVEFLADLPAEVAEAYLPRAAYEQVEADLEQWRAEQPDARIHIRTCTWQVPLRWFVLVDADERAVSEGEPGSGAGAPPGRRTGRFLVYRTPMSRARRRVARALSVLRRTVEDGAVAEGVEDLGRWLEEFHPRSLVELDYGGLVHLLDDAALREDESARDIATALAALAAQDADAAGTAYGKVTARMKLLQSVESAN